MIDKLKEVAEKVAPKLQEALSGPLQGQAMTFILKRMKIDSEDQIAGKLENDPNVVKQLKDAELDYINLIDAPAPYEKRDDIPLIVITIIYNVGYFVLLALFLKFTFGGGMVLDEWVKGIIGTLIGVLTAQLPTMNGYWFGSSAGSAKKTEALTRQADKG